MDFGDLKGDKAIETKLADLQDSLDKTKKVLDTVLSVEDISSLSARDRVTFDLFQCYCLNTLFWVYLRTKGVDPNTNEVKNELNRIKSYMVKAKEAHDRNTIRPKLDVPVAQRFIKHGIGGSEGSESKAKKIKFD